MPASFEEKKREITKEITVEVKRIVAPKSRLLEISEKEPDSYHRGIILEDQFLFLSEKQEDSEASDREETCYAALQCYMDTVDEEPKAPTTESKEEKNLHSERKIQAQLRFIKLAVFVTKSISGFPRLRSEWLKEKGLEETLKRYLAEIFVYFNQLKEKEEKEEKEGSKTSTTGHYTFGFLIKGYGPLLAQYKEFIPEFAAFEEKVKELKNLRAMAYQMRCGQIGTSYIKKAAKRGCPESQVLMLRCWANERVSDESYVPTEVDEFLHAISRRPDDEHEAHSYLYRTNPRNTARKHIAAYAGSYVHLGWDTPIHTLRAYCTHAEGRFDGIPKMGLRSLDSSRTTLIQTLRIAQYWAHSGQAPEAIRWFCKALKIGDCFVANRILKEIPSLFLDCLLNDTKEVIYLRFNTCTPEEKFDFQYALNMALFESPVSLDKESQENLRKLNGSKTFEMVCKENLGLFLKHLMQESVEKRKRICEKFSWIKPLLIKLLMGVMAGVDLDAKRPPDEIVDLTFQLVPFDADFFEPISIKRLVDTEVLTNKKDKLGVLYVVLQQEIDRMNHFSCFMRWFRGKAYCDKSQEKAKKLSAYVVNTLCSKSLANQTQREEAYHSLINTQELTSILQQHSGLFNFSAPTSLKNIQKTIQTLNQRSLTRPTGRS